MTSKTVQDQKQVLDTLIETAEFWPESASADVQAILDEAANNFKAGGVELLDQASQYIWQYYRSVADEYSPEEREDYDIPEIADVSEIWAYVQFRNPPTISQGGTKYEPGRSYISFEGDVEWDPDHGLQLVFEHGLTVCKVGPNDGHHTNANASADETLLGVVFQ